MSGATINVIPVLLAPEKLSKQELIAKCNELHQTLIAQHETIMAVCSKLSATLITAHELGVQLYSLIDSFDANDRPAITLQLRQMSDRRKSYKKPEVH